MGISCLNRSNYFPPEKSRWCDQPPAAETANLCCNYADMCNADLRPRLSVSPSDSILNEGITGNRVSPISFKNYSITI